MRPRQWDTILYALAEEQAGYLTAAQARSAGLHQVRLAQLHRGGDIERVTRGVYRLTRYPVSPLCITWKPCSGHKCGAPTHRA